MNEQPRRATVVLIQRGDPEIGGAIAQGMLQARQDRPAMPDPGGQVEIITADADRQKVVAQLVRIAVGNTKTPDDYRAMIVKARGDYAVHTRPGPIHTVAGKLLLAWAMICEGLRRAYRAQDKVLRP